MHAIMTADQYRYDVSVIIPCFNEEDNIPDIVAKVLESFHQNAIRGEIVLINDGSSDETGPLIKKMSSEFHTIVPVQHDHNLGITEAWSSGISQASGEYVVTIDADMQYHPSDIGVLYKTIKSGSYDMVQGWRKEYKDDNFIRKLISRLFSFILNILFFTRMSDAKSGFVIAKKEVFASVLLDRRKFNLFQHFFILCALKKGYSIKQEPVGFYPRTKGQSFITNPTIFSIKVLLELPKAMIEYGAVSRLFNRGKN